MNDDHPILTTVGLATVALGVLMVLQPGLAATIGVNYAAVLLVGMIALIQGVRVARSRQTSEIRSAETPDVETVETVPTPGDEFDRTVATIRSGPRRVLIRERADLRETLEDAAVTAVADRENCSREAARELVEDGTWTDDVHAAAFLGGPAAPQPRLFHRLKLAARARSQFQFRVRRTADAVARAAGVTRDASDEGASEGDGAGSKDGSRTGRGSDPDRVNETNESGRTSATNESNRISATNESGRTDEANESDRTGDTDRTDDSDDGSRRAEA